ncbi:uncharacterized protein J8A68_000620 [[Candida] subhashii]|uniref:CCHC-type domain-containing protein n=1 Tax=[Candida] subhashii TaxID=561895 RepID=A0A8J5V160_9ASCO|nr:uncharacterized protein J8A68_000620 [[Candida] subhashii]KAG7665795.1 hypothetical protein J8A68_000620 [[Candida] subhashii]
MSIVELSNTVDKLARVINQKNQELEELKKGYDEKLYLINNYVRRLESVITDHCGDDDDDDDDDEFREINDEKLIHTLSNDINCPNCNHKVWNNKESEFILLPKSQVKYLVRGKSTSESNQPETERIHSYTQQTSSSSTRSFPQQQSKSKNKSKVICSFCKEPGHTRAKCLTRLNTPATTN